MRKVMSSAPWREKAKEKGKYEHAKLRAANEPGQKPTMYVPSKADSRLARREPKDDPFEIDPELRYTFQRNFQFIRRVFSIDTLLKPLPPVLGQSIGRNLGFFTRIFTQFFDPKGIENAQKSMGLGQEDKIRRVR
eukprot:Gb_31834 [translate_table: standard]